MKKVLKRVSSERVRLYVRRAGRLRWITKYRVLKGAGASWKENPLRCARYMFLDPEVDTFTYGLANPEDLCIQLASLLDRPADQLEGFLSEAMGDPELGSKLTKDIGWRALFLKRRPPLPSHHLSAWIIVRATKPRVVVETGILEGLGSRTMLRALQLNAAENAPGRLLSFDILPNSGKALIPDRLRDAWEPHYEATPEAFGKHFGGDPVGLFLHDSVPTIEHLRAEADAILPFLAPGAILMTAAGWTGVLDEVAAELGGRCVLFEEEPRDHFYRGRLVAWMRLPGGSNGTDDAEGVASAT